MGNTSIPKPFNLLRWFSVVCLVALVPIGLVAGYIVSYFITQETLQRDAAMTAQFIQNCIEVEGRHAKLGRHVSFPEILDRRVDSTNYGVSHAVAEMGRQEILDHLQSLPDTLLANLFARDGRIIWSTNKALVGTVSTDNHELEEAFRSEIQVARHYTSVSGERDEQKFIVAPKEFFIENYIPLYSAKGNVVLVAEVYKEPRNLNAVIKRGQQMVWGTTVVAGLLVYLFLFKIIRRGASLLEAQQKQLVELDAMAYVGEMATAVAHSLRSPLASIRSSAELAIDADAGSVQKNARDIITQVDFLSRWVREMLTFTRPVTGEPEPVKIVAVLDEVLASFTVAMAAVGVRVERNIDAAAIPDVEGNTGLMTQALHSVLANAIEAMPQGGTLHVSSVLEVDRGRCQLIIRDTGCGMNEKQLKTAFRPFQTTKRQGLGVGLPMVKRVMERFGGGVSLSSKENVGTEVRLQFRLAKG